MSDIWYTLFCRTMNVKRKLEKKVFYFVYVGIDRGFVIPKWLDYAIPPLPLKIFKFKTLILDIQKVHLNKSQWLESLSSFRFTFLSNVMSTINEGNSEAFGNLWNIIFDCRICCKCYEWVLIMKQKDFGCIFPSELSYIRRWSSY